MEGEVVKEIMGGGGGGGGGGAGEGRELGGGQNDRQKCRSKPEEDEVTSMSERRFKIFWRSRKLLRIMPGLPG